MLPPKEGFEQANEGSELPGCNGTVPNTSSSHTATLRNASGAGHPTNGKLPHSLKSIILKIEAITSLIIRTLLLPWVYMLISREPCIQAPTESLHMSNHPVTCLSNCCPFGPALFDFPSELHSTSNSAPRFPRSWRLRTNGGGNGVANRRELHGFLCLRFGDGGWSSQPLFWCVLGAVKEVKKQRRPGRIKRTELINPYNVHSNIVMYLYIL